VTDAAEWYRWFKHTGGRQLGQLLMREWDPIGVAHTPEAADEYDNYIGLFADRLRRGASTEDVAALLDGAERDMGIAPRLEETRRVATLLRDWYPAADAPR